MDLNTLISQYGYAALVIGSLAEGETVTLLGGVAAHQGLLKFPLVVLSVALGGMIGDQVLYLCGRRFGGKLLRRFSKHQDKIERAQKLIQRHPYLFVIGTRFMYGFRVIGPTLIGASQLPPKIFLPLNILGAFAWALIFTTIATPMNGMDDSDVKPDAEPSIPLRRFGATHEIASLVAWLCSEGANYTTGQSLIVDGGFMLANPQFNPE